MGLLVGFMHFIEVNFLQSPFVKWHGERKNKIICQGISVVDSRHACSVTKMYAGK